MTENQEQKSASEDTSFDISSVDVEEIEEATPYKVHFTVPYAYLRKRFDEYWAENMDSIIERAKLKLKKGKGGRVNSKDAQRIIEKTHGLSRIYRNVLADILISVVEEKLGDVMFVNVVDLHWDGKSDDTEVLGVLYYWPRLEWPSNVDFKLTRMSSPKNDDVWNGKLLQLKNKHRQSVEGGDTVEGDCELLLDLIVSCENSAVDEESVRNRWLDFRSLYAEVQDALKDRKKGDLFEFEFMPKAGRYKNKTLHYHAKIHDIRKLEYPELNDGLAKLEHFDTLEEMKQQFLDTYRKQTKENEEGYAVNHIISEIVTKSNLPAIPESYLESNGRDLMQQHFAKFKDKDKALAMLGVDKDVDALSLFKQHMYQNAIQLLAVRTYCRKFDLDPQDEGKLREHICSSIEWEEK